MIGSGGHAGVLLDVLQQLNFNVAGIVSPNAPNGTPIFDGLKHYSSDDDILSFNPNDILLINGIGSLPGSELRFNIYRKFKDLGYNFMTVISPQAIVSPYATLFEGVQIMPGSIVNTNASIGEGSIINSGAIVEHDCVIGRHNHIAPGAVLSGSVKTGNYVHIAIGASVIQGVTIGDYALVACGASLIQDLDCNSTLYRAKPFLKKGNK